MNIEQKNMPNFFAYVMLITWPLVARKILSKLDFQTGVILCYLIPYLILPVKVKIDLPLIPALDKTTIPSLSIFLCLLLRRQRIKLFPKNKIMFLVIVALLLSPAITIATNSDQLFYSSTIISGMGFKDLISLTLKNLSLYIIPLMIGYTFLHSDESHKKLIQMIAISGLIYSIPTLWEIRMSPQLHAQIYGFFPHSFNQQMRQEGFRAVVFLGHGLLVAIFMAMSLLAIATTVKEKLKLIKLNSIYLLAYIVAVLLLSKSLGALFFAIIFCPLIFFFKPINQVRIAAIFLAIVMFYPSIRSNQIIPIEDIVSFFESIDEERAGSLVFRLDNEDILLDKASERPLFGWGTWGRNRVYSEITGKDISITDGEWIIHYGVFGWFGYIAIFGLLCIPVFILLRTCKIIKSAPPQYTATLCLILTINVLDVIPNASLNTVSFLISGAILGKALSTRKHIIRKN